MCSQHLPTCTQSRQGKGSSVFGGASPQRNDLNSAVLVGLEPQSKAQGKRGQPGVLFPGAEALVRCSESFNSLRSIKDQPELRLSVSAPLAQVPWVHREGVSGGVLG